MIYVSAIYANAEQTMVTGTDANGATETVAWDYTLFRQPEHGPLGFIAAGGVIADYVAPVIPVTIMCPTCLGSGRVPAGED